MKATLADAALMRDAGRFVWLELDFDKPINQAFLARHGVRYTPTLFVLDPADERAAATNFGGLTLADLQRFLDRGERGVKGRESTAADISLARGDAMLGLGKVAEAAAAYREAFHVAKPAWPQRNHALASLTRTLVSARQYREVAEIVEAEAPKMPRDSSLATVVLWGLSSANMGGTEPWAIAARKKLEPLAAEGAVLPAALRDHRFQLYQQLVQAADLRGDKAALTQWGDRWLAYIDSTRPANEDERSALDIARVDAASEMEQPARVIPALIASERAMPSNYNASLRLAQMLVAAKRDDEGLAACDRGLAHVSGPIGRSWLLRTKAQAFVAKGDRAAAHRALEEALQNAQKIGTKESRENSMQRIAMEIKEVDKR
jgi:predicted negative regulator of RcsB-dependent stress response